MWHKIPPLDVRPHLRHGSLTRAGLDCRLPDLAALGAIDVRLISGLAIDNNDALSSRDEGLEFLDVADQLSVTVESAERQRRRHEQ